MHLSCYLSADVYTSFMPDVSEDLHGYLPTSGDVQNLYLEMLCPPAMYIRYYGKFSNRKIHDFAQIQHFLFFILQ